MSGKKQDEIGMIIQEIIRFHHIRGFDDFIIEQMGYRITGEEKQDHEIRRKSFLQFRRLSENYPFASMPTMRRWFGIGGEKYAIQAEGV